MNREGFFAIDWSLLIPAGILLVMGLTTLFSINTAFFTNQLIFAILSIFAFLLFSHINYKILPSYSVPIYIASLVVLALVLVLGFESRGAIRWIDILGFRIQFSEILKPFLIISLASFLANRRSSSLETFILAILLLLPLAFFIYLQPDLGNALIYTGATFFTLLVFGFPIFWFGCGILAMALLMPIFWQFLHSYQKQRILTFLHPTSDPLGSSYNAIQALIAVGSGALLGKGLGQGTQSTLRFLPERHTDFIFATIAESFGLIGGVLVILTFTFLLYRIFVLFQNCEDKFRKTFSACSFFLLLIQFFINIGMNIGLVPIVGITLPFVSYGGSSVLSSFILLGILSSFTSSIKNKDTLEIR